MIKCDKCGNVISDGTIIKAVSVIQLNYKEQLCNVKCRKCKQWMERVPINKLFLTNLLNQNL